MKMPWVLISGMAAVAALALAVLPTSAETVRRLPAPAADETTDAAAPRIATIGSYRMPGRSAAAQLIAFDARGIAVSAGCPTELHK